jgi:3-oxoacyl-[acyl-carrier protein] reductase
MKGNATGMDLHLAGLRALVTGGTRGIGRAVVETLLDEGACVAFCARGTAAVIATQAELGTSGKTVIGSAVDVADGAALAAWVAESAATLGGIDILVANASAMATADTEENWAKCFGIDVMGTVHMVEAALPYLAESNAASIVTVSSVSGREIDFFEGPYGSMKAALIHYTQGLAHRLAPRGIRANTVSPGNTLFEGGSWDDAQRNRPEMFEAALALIPAGRLGTPQEMAAAVAFLASPVSGFTSGTNLVVDGALTRGVQL